MSGVTATTGTGLFGHSSFATTRFANAPVSVFCADPDLGRSLVRFAFCKRDEVLEEAVSRLAALRTEVRA